jgi:hypothetical protein
LQIRGGCSNMVLVAVHMTKTLVITKDMILREQEKKKKRACFYRPTCLILLNIFMKLFHWIATALVVISATRIHIKDRQEKANSKLDEEGYENKDNKINKNQPAITRLKSCRG